MIRLAKPDDAAGICAIYNPYVLETTITFEEQAVPAETMRERIIDVTAHLPWLVCESEGVIAAYAYANPWKARTAYRYTVELTVYVAEGRRQKGLGTHVYCELIDRLRQQGIHRAIGGVLLPNAGSIALHKKLGFKKVAHFDQVGWKFNQWIDLDYWQLDL